MRVRFAVNGLAAPTDLVVDCPAGSVWSSLSAPLARHGLSAQRAYVDGVELTPASAVGEPPLIAGAVITFGGPEAGRRSRWSVHVISGPAAGAEFDLPSGRVVIGRAAAADIVIPDPEVSRTHAELDVRPDGVAVRDLGSANGTVVDEDVIRLGRGSTLRVIDKAAATPACRAQTVGGVPVATRPDGHGHLVVNVPPRPTREPPSRTLDMPGTATPPAAGSSSTLSWVTMLTPPLLAVPLALAYGARLFMVAMLAPLAAFLGWTAERIRGVLRHRRTRARTQTDLAVAQGAIGKALTAERRSRMESAPDAAALLAMAERTAPGLWQRRREDETEFLRCRIGTADLPASLTVRHADGTIHHPNLPAAPVTVPLAGRIVGVAGPRQRVLALARFLIAQLAVLHSPDHVQLTVIHVRGAAREWSWTRWLPHRAVAPTTVAVVDRGGALRADPPAIYLSEAVSELPAECDVVVEMTGRESTRMRVASTAPDTGAGSIAEIIPDLVSGAWVERCARALACLRVDPRTSERPTTLPDHVGLLELFDDDPFDPSTIKRRWRSASSPRAVIGVTTSGRYVIDLCRDGPHLLVAGTTGAGKSELLRTLVASLALSSAPDHLIFVLVDYKGGAAFGECTALPHTVGILTDLDQRMTERALIGLDAELRRRERLFAQVGAADLDAYVDRVGAARAVARLVIVVDEFATLVDDLPDFIAGLVSVARRGRSLGVHLVLATQRPAGAINSDIRANVGMRIALRVTDQGDSSDVVGVADAASISARTPGRAIVRTHAGDVLHIQTALVGGPTSLREPLVHVVAPEDAEPPPPSSGVSLPQLVQTLRAAVADHGTDKLNPPWTEPLPVHVTTETLATGDDSGNRAGGLRLGLIDRPGAQRHGLLTVDLDVGMHWLVGGGSASGKTLLIRTLIAQAAASQHAPPAVHVYVITNDDALADAALLRQCGAVVTATDRRRLERLLARLNSEIAQRRREGRRTPRLLLAIDGWAAIVDAAESVDHGLLTAAVQRLLRDGPAAGLTVVITGDRSVLTSRIAAYAANRIILRLDDVTDYAGAGVSLRLVQAHLPPGRGILMPAGELVQIAVPVPDLREIAASQSSTASSRTRWSPPLRVEPLPALVTADKLCPDQPHGASALWVPLGVGGDDLRTVGVDLAGRILLVAGVRRSGRTTAVGTIGEWLRRRDVNVLTVPRDTTDDALLRPTRPTVFMADDAEAILGTATDDALMAVLQQDRRCGAVLAGLPDTFAYTYRGASAFARRDRLVLLLGPPAAADVELAGERIRKEEHPPAGRGVLVADGAVIDIQVAITGGLPTVRAHAVDQAA